MEGIQFLIKVKLNINQTYKAKANISYFIILLLLLGCDPIDDKLIIKNSTKVKVYYLISPFSNLYNEDTKEVRSLSKTLKGSGRTLTYMNYIDTIEANTIKKEFITGNNGAWERYINRTCEEDDQSCKNSKLRLYTFNIDTLNKYSWEEVVINNLYEKKIELSIKELEEKNWIIAID